MDDEIKPNAADADDDDDYDDDDDGDDIVAKCAYQSDDGPVLAMLMLDEA